MRNPNPRKEVMGKQATRVAARKPKAPAVKRRKPKPGSHTEPLTWEGLTLSISYDPQWLPGSEGYSGRAHLEVRVIAPERAPLPITDTGYRSHFLLAGIVEGAGGPAAYVRRWLDEAARHPSWPRLRDRWRQYSLF
jgi:hypothetical protein